ncbi:hypothetical protein L1987_49134 [Smallanthus sonchifolius]|uniref:Uncharacterized protein n=1 Tax=Smallanthus sonchifolius TaxID=185202 RepID=A0ACB9FUV2_9ASTR|nr:hypothetical protein L1987_49134 [Smallanthus sonchifolius]
MLFTIQRPLLRMHSVGTSFVMMEKRWIEPDGCDDDDDDVDLLMLCIVSRLFEPIRECCLQRWWTSIADAGLGPMLVLLANRVINPHLFLVAHVSRVVAQVLVTSCDVKKVKGFIGLLMFTTSATVDNVMKHPKLDGALNCNSPEDGS